MILENGTPKLLYTLDSYIFFTYYSLLGKNYIPGRVIYERIIDWDLHTINNKKTLSRIKIIFNWYIESQKPVNFKSGIKDIDNSKYKDYINCDIKYIYISFRKLKNNNIINPFEKDSYNELAVIKIDSSKIPIYKHTSDLTKPDQGYGNGYLTMITGGKEENTTFWITQKYDDKKEFITKDKITSIDWKSSKWVHDESNTGYYFTIINNKSPLIKTNISDNDGYYDFKIVSPKSSTWEPKDIDNINIFDKSVWWRNNGQSFKDNAFNIEYSMGGNIWDSNTSKDIMFPDMSIIKQNQKTEWGTIYNKTLEWNRITYKSYSEKWQNSNSTINIPETANYNLQFYLRIITVLIKKSTKPQFLFPQGQRMVEWGRIWNTSALGAGEEVISVKNPGPLSAAVLSNLEYIPASAKGEKNADFIDKNGFYTGKYTILTDYSNPKSNYPTIVDYDSSTGLGGNSGILYWVELQKKDSNGKWVYVKESDKVNIYDDSNNSDPLNRIITQGLSTYDKDMDISFSNIYLQKGEYQVVLNWTRNQKYLFGVVGDKNKEWKYATDNNGKISINNPDSLGNYNFQAKLYDGDGGSYHNTQEITISKITKDGDLYDKMINKFRPKTHLKNDTTSSYPTKLYSNNYSYLILVNTFSRYRTSINVQVMRKLFGDDAVHENWRMILGRTENSYLYDFNNVKGNLFRNTTYLNWLVYNSNEKSYSNVNFENILEDNNTLPILSGKFSLFEYRNDNQKKFDLELDFIHTFDVNDAYINESFFKTYGIITKSYLLDSGNNFIFKKDDIKIKNLDINYLSDFDNSILIGRHFAVFKCNVLMENVLPTILPYSATTNLSEADILNAGKIIFKPNNNKDDITFINRSTSGYNIQYTEEYTLDKIKKFSLFFKIWLKLRGYLDFTTNPDKNWTIYINNQPKFIGYHQSNVGAIYFDTFNTLIVNKNLELLKGTGFPDKVSIELIDIGEQPDNDYWGVQIFSFDNTTNTYKKRTTAGIIDTYWEAANMTSDGLQNTNNSIIDSININISEKSAITGGKSLNDFLKDRWIKNKKNINFKYYLILDTDSGEKIYSKATEPFYTKNKLEATKYDILVEDNKTWTDPSISNLNGSWYQLYDSWEFKDDGLNVRPPSLNPQPTFTSGWYPYNQAKTDQSAITKWGSEIFIANVGTPADPGIQLSGNSDSSSAMNPKAAYKIDNILIKFTNNSVEPGKDTDGLYDPTTGYFTPKQTTNYSLYANINLTVQMIPTNLLDIKYVGMNIPVNVRICDVTNWNSSGKGKILPTTKGFSEILGSGTIITLESKLTSFSVNNVIFKSEGTKSLTAFVSYEGLLEIGKKYAVLVDWEIPKGNFTSAFLNETTNAYVDGKIKLFVNGGTPVSQTDSSRFYATLPSTLPLFPLHYYFNNTFNKNQIYQFRLIINNYTIIGKSKLILITPWFDYFEFNNLISTNKLIPTNFYFYSKIEDLDKNLAKTKAFLSSKTNYTFTPESIKDFEYFKSTTNPKNPITILGDTNFGKYEQSLKGLLISKSWFIQGYAMFNSYVNNDTGLTINYDSTSVGWHFINNQDFKKYKYIWYDKKPNTSNYPIGYNINSENIFDSVLDGTNTKYISNNFICRYIKSNTFNLSFRYDNKINKDLSTFDGSFIENSTIGLNFYIGSKLPKDKDDLKICILNGTIKLIASLKESKYYEFLSLSGNNYLFFIAEPATINNSAIISTLSDIEIVTTYHDLNNDVVLLDNIKGSTDLIYTSKVGIGDNYSNNSIIDYKIVNSKIGNGSFESGTWNNGTWNNGWRTSKNYNFLDVSEFYNLNERWSFTIYGSTNSTSNFEVGDKVSISNIVAIDINNDRRLLKNSFKIIYKSDNTITLELFYDFPIRSIEKDSRNHLISVSKNIWLNGLFLNGAFNGNWIDGVFNGYPFITKMENSHWIDGKFDGGHFKSNIISFTASLIIPPMESLDIYWRIKVENLEGHNLELNDNFDIKYFDSLLDDQLVDLSVTDIIDSCEFNCNLLKNFGTSSSSTEIVKTVEITTKKKSSLIQNFNFIDNNISGRVISDIKSSSNLRSNYLFLYNSWLDLVYEQNSATNIFKPQTLIDNNDNFYSENNLYGYITTDVLSSNSKFRDSFSKKIREYKLGVKFKMYYDYIGDSSFFDDYLHSIYTPKKVTDLGWKWNVSSTTLLNGGTSSFVLYRSDEKSDQITGKELVLSAIGDGGTLNIQNDNLFTTTKIPNRYTEGIKSLGYSMVSFDLIDKIADGKTFSGDYNKDKIKNKSLGIIDSDLLSKSNNSLNFSNINETIINLDGKTQSIAMSYLPVYKNINHLMINDVNKVEYFFNKRDLMMKLSGQGNYGSDKIQIILDNLKFYELDMIPFFQYLKEENVNNSIQIPNGIYYKSYNKIYEKTLNSVNYSLSNISKITATNNNNNSGNNIGNNIGNNSVFYEDWTTFYENFKYSSSKYY